MTIRKDVTVNINGKSASVDNPIVIYERDYGIELYFKLMNYKYKYDKHPDNILSSNDEDVLEAYTTIVNPKGEELSQLNGEVVDDIVMFLIDKSYTDELSELGAHELQIHIKCEHSEFSIPPISFDVIERIKGEIPPAVIDTAVIDESFIQTDEGSFVDEDGKLNIVWSKGDVISSVKMNQMVQYINDTVGDINDILDAINGEVL